MSCLLLQGTLKLKSGRKVQFCPVEWHQDWDALCVVVMCTEIGTEGSVLPVMWHLLLGSPTRVEMQHGEVEIRTGGSVCPVEGQLILERPGC